MSAKVDFEKFDGKGNFSLWQIRVSDLLVQQKAHRVLSGKKPEKMSDEDWSDQEMLAFSTIRSCLADNVLYEVMQSKTADDLWAKLEKLYMGKNMTNKLMVKKQLYSKRMAEGGNVGQHIDEMNKLFNNLLKLEVKIEEEDKALILLCSLPESFDGLTTTLVYGKDTLVYDEVVAILRSKI